MRKSIKILPLAATLIFSLAIAGCGGDNDSASAPVPPIAGPPPPTPPAPPPPPPPQTSLNVTRCLNQEVAPGRSVASLVLPDTLQVDLNAPSGFPNGRRLPDSVVDITLAALLLDLRVHSAGTLAGLPLNPAANDRAFRADFPFIAAPQGTPPIASGGGSRFRFRDDLPSAYVRVDRTGFPATSTALISAAQKLPFNDANPPDDIAGRFVPDITATLATLATQLDDDLKGAGLTPCAS